MMSVNSSQRPHVYQPDYSEEQRENRQISKAEYDVCLSICGGIQEMTPEIIQKKSKAKTTKVVTELKT